LPPAIVAVTNKPSSLASTTEFSPKAIVLATSCPTAPVEAVAAKYSSTSRATAVPSA